MTTLLTRREGALLAVGGPTVVVDVAGLRFVTDPTFDQPGEYGDLRKTRGPAVSPSSVADAPQDTYTNESIITYTEIFNSIADAFEAAG